MAALIKAVNWSSVLHYPREGYAFLEASDSPVAKAVVSAVASEPVQAASQKALQLLEAYSSFLIPAVGIAVQLLISHKARGWADARRIKDEQLIAQRKVQQEKEEGEKRKKTAVAEFVPKVIQTPVAEAGAGGAKKRGKK